jgi:hypothetical protein
MQPAVAAYTCKRTTTRHSPASRVNSTSTSRTQPGCTAPSFTVPSRGGRISACREHPARTRNGSLKRLLIRIRSGSSRRILHLGQRHQPRQSNLTPPALRSNSLTPTMPPTAGPSALRMLRRTALPLALWRSNTGAAPIGGRAGPESTTTYSGTTTLQRLRPTARWSRYGAKRYFQR